MPPGFLRGYFNAVDRGYQINETVRKRVLFAAHNLLRDPPFSRLDLVTCRNLLIYLDREVQREILQQFHFALRPGGYLFLGGSETADAAHGLFEPVDRKHRIYRATLNVRGSRNTPTFPFGGIAQQLEQRRVAAPPPPTAKPPSVAELHRNVAFEDESSGTVLVDQDLEILHTAPGASQFLRFVEGNPSRQLLSVVQKLVLA